MRPISTYLLVAGLLLAAFQVSSQPLITTFSPASVSANVGGTVSLQLKVQNFSAIQSFQVPITFNSAILQFTSITNAALPGFASSNYNATTGKVVVSWYPDLAQYPNGFSIADNSSIFTINFNVVANGATTVNIAAVSPGIEVVRNNDVITVQFGSGGTSVTGGSGGPGPLTGFHVLANTITIPQGQTGCMPVKVHDFDNIVSLAYAMHWDPAVLQYQNTQAYNLPDLAGSSFNLFPAGSSTLLLSWYEQALTGITRADGATIYDVCFKAVGAPGSQSMVVIDGNGFPPGGGGAEVINLGGSNVWMNDSGVSDTIFVVTAPPPPDAVTFHADTIEVPENEIGCVQVRVKNFEDVISIQFGMTYDANIISFDHFEFGGNPLTLSNANFNATIPGEIKFTWFDQQAVGLDLPDSSLIFSVCFEAIGDTGTMSPLTFTSLPGFAVEVVKEPQGEVIPALLNGKVIITGFVDPGLELQATPANCFGSSTGSISAVLNPASLPMTYTWSGTGINPPVTTNDSTMTGLVAGTYSVTLTVANGATFTATVTLPQPPQLSIQQATPTNTSCFNGQDGAITIAPTGGTSPYTSYAWAGPQYTNTTTTPSISGIKAGNYTVTVTDSNGCTFVSNPPIQVGQPGDINVAPSLVTVSPVTCFGLTNGTIALPTPGGGTSPFGYAWAGPNGYTASTKSITGLAGGQYTVTITDNNSCTKSFQFTVTAPALPLTVSQNGMVTDVTCFGYNNGQACVQVSGGTMPYVPSWRLNSPNGQVIATGPCPNNLVPGNYVVVVTDNNNCTAVIATQIEVDGPTEPIEINEDVDHVLCADDGNGVITLNPAGGNGAPFTVNWSNGQTGTQLTNLDGGSYTPTVTDAAGCTIDFNPIPVNEPTAITVDAATTPQDGMTPGSITIQVGGGVSPYSYAWTGPNGFTSSMQNLAAVGFGIYNLTVTDANGCTHVMQVEVETTNIVAGTTATATPSCNDDGTITFYIPPGAVPVVSILIDGNTYIVDNDTFTVYNLPSGIYQPTISDGAGNSHTMDPISVGQLAQALVGDSKTNPFDDLMNGSITLTPIPSNSNLTYQWAHGPMTNTLMNLDSGTYVVTITNLASGCTSVNTYTLVRTYQPFVCQEVDVTPASCPNTADGAIKMFVTGADGPNYTYQWSGPNGFSATTRDITGLYPGAYTLTVIDESLSSHLCQVVQVSSLSNLTITNVNETSNYNGFQVSGTSVCNGKATVVYTGNSGTVSVLWSSGGTGFTDDKLCGGTYSVTLTDALGCTAVWVDSLTVPQSIIGTAEIASNYNGYDISCFGECDGRANISAVGGVAPYKITWPSGQVDQNLPVGGISQANQLCGGDYQVTITDANGVSAVSTVTVLEPEPLEVEFEDTPPTSFSACNAEVLAFAPVGVGDISYTWSTSNGLTGDGPLAENLCAGSYITYVIEDDNGCTAIGRHLVPYPEDGCLQVRPVITPAQADGNNDYTLITCIESFPNNTFEVYNRWGQLVYQTTGYNNGDRRWEGLTASGQLLPDGVYFFVLKYKDDNNNDQVLKGYINLLR
ncbi:MAG: gliding motility-associated C-terminal domain-containing protein [Saprospiraceae bacterium]